MCLGGQARAFLPEQQQAFARQHGSLERATAGKVVDARHDQTGLVRPRDQLRHGLVVAHVLVSIGDHGAALVPPAPAHDMHLGGEKRVGGAYDRADVQIVLPVLDRDVEVVAARVKLGDDRFQAPIPVPVDDVAPVAMRQQFGVKTRVVGPGTLPRPDAHCVVVLVCHHGYAA
jgi:hypothetical protein